MENSNERKKEKTAEIRIPLIPRTDDFGGTFYVGVPFEVDVNINLADFVPIVLMGNDNGNGKGNKPQIVLKPRSD